MWPHALSTSASRQVAIGGKAQSAHSPDRTWNQLHLVRQSTFATVIRFCRVEEHGGVTCFFSRGTFPAPSHGALRWLWPWGLGNGILKEQQAQLLARRWSVKMAGRPAATAAGSRVSAPQYHLRMGWQRSVANSVALIKQDVVRARSWILPWDIRRQGNRYKLA